MSSRCSSQEMLGIRDGFSSGHNTKHKMEKEEEEKEEEEEDEEEEQEPAGHQRPSHAVGAVNINMSLLNLTAEHQIRLGEDLHLN